MYDDATRGHETLDRPAAETTNQRLLADGGTTEVCPECDRPGIRQRMLEKPNSCSDGPRWRCDECGATFDEPVEREKRDHSGRRGLANQLIHAEQGDLVTDGGAVREPTIYKVVELPEDEKGAPCPRWQRDEHGTCDAPSEFVFVYEVSLDPEDDRRKNCLCCVGCKPVESVITDGGRTVANGGQSTTERDPLPKLPWCRNCWDRAGEGTRRERDGVPETCQHCGSSEVFWI